MLKETFKKINVRRAQKDSYLGGGGTTANV